MSRSPLAKVAEEVGADSDSDYTPNTSRTDTAKSPKSDGEDYGDEFDQEDVGAGAGVLLHRAGVSPKRTSGGSGGGGNRKVNDAADRLVSASSQNKTMFETLYGVSSSQSAYAPSVVVRKNKDGTYNVKFKNGEKALGVTKSSFKLSRDEREDRRFELVAGDRVMCKKRTGPNKKRMHEMSKPKVYKSTNKFSSEEDAAECYFVPKLKNHGQKKNGDGEQKDGEADFLIRMEAKETARRAELERKRFEAKREEQKKKKTAMKMTDEGSERFLKRLAKSEAEKQKRYKKLQKELTPAFDITERQIFDETTGKIITVSVEKTEPDTAAFLARLAADAAKKKEKAKQRVGFLNNTSPGRRRKGNSSKMESNDGFSNTFS